MMSRRWLIAVGLALAVLTACATPSGEPGPPWQSAIDRDHPLAGRIWRPAERRFAAPDEVVAALAKASFVMLGEKHDNADHHRIQAWLLERLITSGRRPAVAFEMFTRDQEPALAAHLSAHPGDAAGIAKAVDWAASGWPDWDLYRPIAQAALDGGLPLMAASLPRHAVRAVARKGVGGLEPEIAERLGEDPDLPVAQAAALRQEIIEVHCNQLPESMIDPMVTVTTVKDGFMADSLIRGARAKVADAALLIAGNGHARADRGVPWYLGHRAPSAIIVTIGLLEVAPGEADPAAYAARFDTEKLPFDFVWFTPRLDDQDPCAVYADQLRRAKQRHENKTSE